MAFGKPVIQHPLLARQFEQRQRAVEAAFALAWEAVCQLSACWHERPPYSDRYHLFRLVAHLAKYWTAETAVQTAEWAIEVHGGAGVLAENGVERLLREAMILSIWEGTPHRQMLDGLEVMLRKNAHHLLLDSLARRGIATHSLASLRARLDDWLAGPAAQREAEAEAVFSQFAADVAGWLAAPTYHLLNHI